MNELDSWNRKWRTLWCWTHIYVHFKRAQAHARRLPEEARYAYWSERHSHFAELIWRNISELRGWWVKVGQFLSTRSDLLPKEYISYLSKLQDMMPWTEWNIMEKILNEELGQNWKNIFIYIKKTPIGTASIAQVHEATLKNGTKVVIKIQHPNVQEILKQDMDNLTQLSWAFGIVEKGLDFFPILQEWQKSASKELDFNNELKHQQRALDLFRNSGIDITIPIVYPEYSGKRILTMEFIHGFKITDKNKLLENNVNIKELLESLCDSFAYQIHIEGFFHGDPHPGNVFVVFNEEKKKYQPALLDWGLVKVFEQNIQKAFSKMVYCVSTLNLMGLMESFEEMGFKFKDQKNTIDPEMYMDALRIAFRDNEIQPNEHEEIRESSYAAYKTATELPYINNKQINDINPLEDWPKDIIFFIRIASLIHGICIELNETIPFLKILSKRAQQYLYNESYKSIFHPINNIKQIKNNEFEILKKSKFHRKLNDFVSKVLKENNVLGIQLAIIKNNNLLSEISKGKMGSLDSRDIQSDTLFNGFFINIGILVIGILLCVDKGYISLDDPICHYWDGFIRYGKRNITLRHILTHRSGIHSFFPENFNLSTLFNYTQMIRIIENSTPQLPINTNTHYNPFFLGWVLSELISLVSNEPTPEFIQKNLFTPFNLQNDMIIFVSEQIEENYSDHQKSNSKEKNFNTQNSISSYNINDSLSSENQFSFFSTDKLTRFIGLNKNHIQDISKKININHQFSYQNNLLDIIIQRFATVSRKLEFTSISHQEVIKKFRNATNSLKSNHNISNSENKKFNRSYRKQKKASQNQTIKKLSTFQILQLKPHVMDPLVYNSKKVITMWIPPTNGKYTALSLAKFYQHLANGEIISKELIKQSMKSIVFDHTIEGLILTCGASRKWSLGFQILECEYLPDHIFIHEHCLKKNLSLPNIGQIFYGIGHSDIGGNASFSFPDFGLSFAILTNDYIKGSYISQIIIRYILKNFGLILKNYVPIHL